MYCPKIGEFTTMDDWEGDMSNPITLNKYLYANANPVNMVDPSGHDGLLDLMMTVSLISVLAASDAVAVRGAIDSARRVQNGVSSAMSTTVIVSSATQDFPNWPNKLPWGDATFQQLELSAAKQVDDADALDVRTMVIVGHADWFRMDLPGADNSPNKNWPPESDSTNPALAMKIDQFNATSLFSNLLHVITFAPNAKIWLLGCREALGPVPQLVANATRVTVYASKYYTYPNPENPAATKQSNDINGNQIVSTPFTKFTPQ